jgi:hypothetical protein
MNSIPANFNSQPSNTRAQQNPDGPALAAWIKISCVEKQSGRLAANTTVLILPGMKTADRPPLLHTSMLHYKSGSRER